MKLIKYLPLLAFIVIFAGFVKATPAHAKDSGISGSVKVEIGDDNHGGDNDSDENESNDSGKDSDDDKNDDRGDKNNDDDSDEDRGDRRGFFGAWKGNDKDDDSDDRDNKFWSGIVGKVTAKNEMTLTVSSMTPWNKDSKTTIYTVNASDAKIEKEGVDNETLSDIKIGDMIIVEGTVTGTTVMATEIHSGWFKAKWEDAKDSFVVSGDPVVGGTVTAVSGTTITIKNKSDVSYTIEAKDSKFMTKGSSDASMLSDINVGDNILVQGKIIDTSVTAKLIIETSLKVSSDMNDNNGEHRGFFNRIGLFFKGWFTK